MRMNLKVPFAEKDDAKKLGARWDAARKLWYVEGKSDLAAFARWSPVPHDAGAPGATAAAASRAAGKTAPAAGIVQIGSRYVERPRACDCLPWEDCDACRSYGGLIGDRT